MSKKLFREKRIVVNESYQGARKVLEQLSNKLLTGTMKLKHEIQNKKGSCGINKINSSTSVRAAWTGILKDMPVFRKRKFKNYFLKLLPCPLTVSCHFPLLASIPRPSL